MLNRIRIERDRVRQSQMILLGAVAAIGAALFELEMASTTPQPLIAIERGDVGVK